MEGFLAYAGRRARRLAERPAAPQAAALLRPDVHSRRRRCRARRTRRRSSSASSSRRRGGGRASRAHCWRAPCRRWPRAASSWSMPSRSSRATARAPPITTTARCRCSRRPGSRRWPRPKRSPSCASFCADPIMSVPATSRASRLPEYLAGLYALLIIYASLESFSGLDGAAAGHAVFPVRAVAAALHPLRRRSQYSRLRSVRVFRRLVRCRRTPLGPPGSSRSAPALLLSFAMETLQMFIPTRDASAMDLVCNAAGAGVGGLAAIAFDRAPRLRASVAAWRRRVFVEGGSADLGLALLAIWLLAQLNPGIPLFAATFDPSLELTRDLAGTLLQAAESAFNVIGVGLFLALLLRQRRFVGGAVLMLIGTGADPQGRRGERADPAVGAGNMDQARRLARRRRRRAGAAARGLAAAARRERRCARSRCWPRWSRRCSRPTCGARAHRSRFSPGRTANCSISTD